jgi:hypothetical protein
MAKPQYFLNYIPEMPLAAPGICPAGRKITTAGAV